MRSRLWVAILAVAAAVAALATAVVRTAVPEATPPSPHLVVIDTPGFWSWAMLDRATMEIMGGPDLTATSSAESMIKVWIVADTLRGYAESGAPAPAEVLELASSAIRHSDNQAAETLYRAGGGDEMIARLIETCGLTDTSLYPDWWSRTEMSARDAVRMGLCLAGGRAAGEEWTDWVLAEMRQVQGSTAEADQPHGGRWGIIDALPPDRAARLAIKNGWTPIWADHMWHLSCLAVAEEWILAVQVRYPVEFGLDHGAGICRDVARQVVTGYE